MFPLLEKHPGFEPYIGRAINNEEFTQSEPSAAEITDVDEKYRDFIRENIVMYESLKKHKLLPIWNSVVFCPNIVTFILIKFSTDETNPFRQ